jgi:OOP family OmpA-OmpF porin
MFNKKTVTTITLASLAGLFIATSASAANNGIYLGGAAGWGDTYQSNVASELNGTHTNSSGFSGRVFEGYQFTENFGLEAGYTKFHDVNLNNDTIDLDTKLKSYSVDVVGKGMVPLTNGFGLFGKLGVAYLNEAFDGSVTRDGDMFNAGASISKVLPTFGAGVSYDINKNVVADVSWMRIQAVGNTALNSTDTAMLGLSYHF